MQQLQTALEALRQVPMPAQMISHAPQDNAIQQSTTQLLFLSIQQYCRWIDLVVSLVVSDRCFVEKLLRTLIVAD